MRPSAKTVCVWRCLFGLCALQWLPASAQEELPELATAVPDVASQIDVSPTANDADIAARLTRIMQATGWFQQPRVEVDEGVVFLTGIAQSEQQQQWAGRLAGNTQDVVAVVNRIDVVDRSLWDLTPAWDKLRQMLAAVVRESPLIGLAFVLLAATALATKWTGRTAAAVFRRRLQSKLLSDVVARTFAAAVLLLGLYVVLKISGLTGLAATLVGGTGLLGLIIGFAFRDIAENFLASMLISMQRPFATGDLIEVAGHRGYVQSVNPRSTLLMTAQGNHVQVPNATIYKETITNFTANPQEQFDFAVGIGYDDSITEAQTVALSVLQDHEAVLEQPEPLVLVEGLGAATVDLRVYFWVDISKYSGLRVRSAIIRLTKHAFQQANISMPDTVREVIFPEGVPVRQSTPEPPASPRRAPAEPAGTGIESAHIAEGEFASEAEEIEQQARQARLPEGGKNLLE